MAHIRSGVIEDVSSQQFGWINHEDIIAQGLQRVERVASLSGAVKSVINRDFAYYAVRYVLSAADWTFATRRFRLSIEAETGNFLFPPDALRIITIDCVPTNSECGWYVEGRYIYNVCGDGQTRYVTDDTKYHGRPTSYYFKEACIYRFIINYLGTQSTSDPNKLFAWMKKYDAMVVQADAADAMYRPLDVDRCGNDSCCCTC